MCRYLSRGTDARTWSEHQVWVGVGCFSSLFRDITSNVWENNFNKVSLICSRGKSMHSKGRTFERLQDGHHDYHWIIMLVISVQFASHHAAMVLFRVRWEKNSRKTCPHLSSSTAQSGGGSFKIGNHRKPIGQVGCCESWMAERSHWWIYLSIYLPTYLPVYLSIYLSTLVS